MDMGLLLREARRLLQTGTVPLRRDHLYRGPSHNGAFCINPEVLEGLQAHFSSRAKQMLLEYRARRVSEERGDTDGRGQGDSALRLENEMLMSVCSDLARRRVAKAVVASKRLRPSPNQALMHLPKGQRGPADGCG